MPVILKICWFVSMSLLVAQLKLHAKMLRNETKSDKSSALGSRDVQYWKSGVQNQIAQVVLIKKIAALSGTV